MSRREYDPEYQLMKKEENKDPKNYKSKRDRIEQQKARNFFNRMSMYMENPNA